MYSHPYTVPLLCGQCELACFYGEHVAEPVKLSANTYSYKVHTYGTFLLNAC